MIAKLTMQVSVVQSWDIQVDGGPSVTLPDSLVKQFENEPQPWLLMKPTCHELCRLLSLDMEKDIGKNPSLAGSDGLMQLKQLRNIQNKLVAIEQGAMASLFDDAEQESGQAAPWKKQRHVKHDHSMVQILFTLKSMASLSSEGCASK